MLRAGRTYEMDMTSGPLFRKIMAFTLPLMLTGVLQLLYTAVGTAVVGRFASSEDLAAVGSSGALVNLVIQLFIGLSTGAAVTVANHYGANRSKEVNETVHTAMLVSAIAGVAVAVFGMLAARQLLELTGTPGDVIDKATRYLTVYFAGMPAAMIYNFGAAILRTIGDTRRPLFYLMIAGAVNIALNLFMVITLKWGATGVALATTVSQTVSAVLIVICLMRSHTVVHLYPRRLRIHPERLLEIARIGVPAGIQSTIFSLSNVLVQSSVNSFGSVTMAGNAAGATLDGFVNIATNTIALTSMSFTGQNMGAHKVRRIGRITLTCAAMVLMVGLSFGALLIAAAPTLLSVYTTDPMVLEQAMIRVRLLCATYVLAGLMDLMAYTLRGMGYSLTPMLVTLIGVVSIRVGWILTIFAANRTLHTLYLSYPASWIGTFAVHAICFAYYYRKLLRDAPEQDALGTEKSEPA